MTKKEFIEVLNKLAPETMIACKLANRAMPETAKEIALVCFINKIENENTEILRSQIKILYEKGCFEFNDHPLFNSLMERLSKEGVSKETHPYGYYLSATEYANLVNEDPTIICYSFNKVPILEKMEF